MEMSSATSFWLWVGFGGLGLGSIILYLLGAEMKKRDQHHAILALVITMIATISYYALARGQADITVGGDVVYYGRYIDWLITTPLLLLSLLLIALPPLKDLSLLRERIGLIGGVIVADILMIVTGTFADLSTNPTDTAVWYTASCLWFLIVIYLMFGEVRRQAYEQSKKIGAAYTTLLLFLSVAWLFYPVVWLLGTTGYNFMTIESETAAYAILDISAKAVFGILTLITLKQLARKSTSRNDSSTVENAS